MKRIVPATLRQGVLPGLIAGVLFLGIALLSGGVSTTPWAMPDAIAHTLGIAVPANYGFALLPVLVGIVAHLVLSITLGAMFAALVAWRRLHGGWLILASILFITVETLIVLWGILHTFLSAATFHYYLGAIPWWGSVLGHYVFGLTLGLLLAIHPIHATPRPLDVPASAAKIHG